MDELESELRRALRREPAPHDFEQRVWNALANEITEPRRRWRVWDYFSLPSVRWTAATLATVLLLGDLGWQRHREMQARWETAQGLQAKTQLEIALKLTGSKLERIREKVEQLNEKD